MGNKKSTRGQYSNSSWKETVLKVNVSRLANPRTKMLLQLMWPQDFADLSTFAIIICEEIIRIDPFWTKMFISSKDPSITIKGEKTATFRKQALLLVDIIQTAVKHAEDLSQIEDLLIKLGRRHVEYCSANTHTSHLDAITIALLNVMHVRMESHHLDLNDQFQVMAAWKTIGDFICSRIACGMEVLP
ncbi:hypothetical protein T10_11283 [Trichinella papuae]|uniref:Globin domain-containing protein n=1 Tax=Trichinella papuae TaxID=268474 RepID=A0A0V1MGT3_9BILA|nr:hypothetical protein T10_11283 [Trichinella papuae]